MGRIGIVLLVVYLHIVSLYLFIRGFLLSRLSLDNVASCDPPDACSLPPTHQRAVVIIIDALRFDLIAPSHPEPPDPYHHGVLTVPAQLTARHPHHSFIFNAYSDPPTTTLQRIKGITTGSLPTFVEMGSNFGASEIEEDSLIKQLRLHHKKLAFMGDDTWMLVFPDSFESNMSHPFPSFDVEDLHTVDNGVIDNIFPLLRSPDKWDFLVAHFLGVDHVGHRLGPSHPTMKTKLTQMNDVLSRIVELLDDDTLLVVLGDHGMDRKGDHGGDGALETSSALWIYSKGIPLFSESMSHQALPRDLRPQSVFPGMDESFRSIQQIDLVPSLALLLGVPIPHNSLGAVIPELFMRIADGKLVLDKATMLNVNQMNGFMQAYRSSPSGSELEPHWRGLRTLFADAISKDAGTLEARFSYLRVGLDVCRQLWAQFDSLLMLIGLGIMASTVIALVGIISPSSRLRTQTEDEMRVVLKRAVVVGLGSGLALGAISAAVQAPLAPLQSGLAASATGTSVFLWTEYSPLQLTFNPSVATVIYILHFLSFFSNSFVFWEERIVPFLLAALMVKPILVGVGAPHHRLRTRLVGFSLLFLVCVRLAANSTVCREEQQPYCTVTFYSSSSASAPPISMIVGSTAAAIALPIIIRRFLKISRADSGSAPIFLETILRTLLLVGMSCWLLEYWESVSFLGAGNDSSLRQLRSALARFGVASAAIAGPYYWFLSPLCLDIVRQEAKSPGGNPVVEVYGFANVFGSSYLLVASLLYALVCMSTQLTGQVVFALALTAALSWLEVVDTLHDSFVLDVVVTSASSNKLAESARSVSFSDTVPFALLGLHTFYGTGHQATLQSLQWKTAFVLTGSVVYPFSPITVALNTFGPQVFFSFSSILLGLWNIPPLPYAAQASFIEKNALQAFLGVLTYYTTLLLGSASAAAILRRHLMVWKVFAPRFMTSAASMLAIDIGGIIGLGLALPLLLRKGLVTFGKAK